jgi:hypothetical protein
MAHDPNAKDLVARVGGMVQPPCFSTMFKGVQFYAKDSDGQWYYVNHADTWQTCPPPFSDSQVSSQSLG